MKLIKHFNRAILFSFAGAIALASCNTHPKSSEDNTSAIGAGHNYTDTSSSSVRVFDQDGRVCVQQSNTYYDVVNASDKGAKIPLLLKIRKTELCYTDSLNKDKVYEISAKSLMDTKAVNWDAKFVATDLQYKDNSLLAIHEGSDNGEDFLRRFSLLDGKEVFSCSYGELKVSIPNVKDKRFIGFTSRKAVSQPIQALNDENLIGLIRYGSSTEAGNIFRVKLKRSKVASKIPSSTPDMVLVPVDANTTAIEDGKSLILMKADEHYQPSDVTDFLVKMTFYYGDDNETTTVTIPVVNDKLDLSQAKYDKDIFDITNF
jgi:hypothetical protein